MHAEVRWGLGWPDIRLLLFDLEAHVGVGGTFLEVDCRY